MMLKLILVLVLVHSSWFQILVTADYCPENEYYDSCPSNSSQDCDVINQDTTAYTTFDDGNETCVPACRCISGYARDNNGDCVPQDYCSKCTGANEVYVCPDCSPQTCETRNNTYFCPETPEDCNYSCRCQNGYFRNKIGECISADDCGKCPGDYEYYSCGSACDNVCGSEYDQDNCNIINIVCNNMCYCERDFARDANGNCIPVDDCPPSTSCPNHERYEECPDAICQAKNCDDAGFTLNCTVCAADDCPGDPGCLCEDGYLRDSTGTCVSTSECPSCGGDANATSGCGVNCGRLCSNYNSSEPVSCVDICYPNSCDCRPGYVYDSNINVCVLPEDCSPVCQENEVYTSCINGGCGDRYCSDINYPDVCIDVISCIGGCECADGYLRNSNGLCVPIEECDNCPENERVAICPAALCSPVNCSDADSPVVCPDIDANNCPEGPGCVCNDGYLRSNDGVCISSDQCPSCGGDPNATSGCGVNCGRLCSNYNSSEPVSCVAICYTNGCDCRPGYVYDSNINVCVLPEDCSPVCQENEVYTSCINGGCDDRYCSDINYPDICIDVISCIAGCECADGYLRNSSGLCVPIEECDNCPENERVAICPAALCSPVNCSDADSPVVCPDIDANECPEGPGCVCNDGYLRGDDGVCVPSDQCPPPPCPTNERYVDCPDSFCQAKTCDDAGFVLNCTVCADDPCPGEPGCVCAEGYLRDSSGICILNNECPSCGGDANATSGCGVNCGRLCSNYNSSEPVACVEICEPNGCDCRPSYVFDSNTKQCVLPEDCTPICKKNEVYSTCVNGGCDKRDCIDLNNPDICINPGQCIDGCVCVQGYLRNSDGLCVPIDQCDNCPPNESFSSCPAADCNPKTCSEAGYPVPCPDIDYDSCPGQPGCVCNAGYLRNNDGVCIPSGQCPSCKGDNNATLGCGINCGRLCSNYNDTIDPDLCPLICLTNSCDCRPDYVYDSNTGKCVLPEDCTVPTCPRKNEVYEACPNICPYRTCGIDDRLIKCAPTTTCKPKCRCKPGLFRDRNKNCVPWEKCNTTCTGANEIYDPCDNPCPARTCAFNRAVVRCKSPPEIGDEECLIGCRCEDGYLRDAKGVCIPEDKCPKKCPINEIYDPCPSCASQNCSTIGKAYSCPAIPADPTDPRCKGACRCKQGFLRDDTGTCIPQASCPKQCKKNEVYDPCPDCSPQTCSSIGQIYHCPLIPSNTSDPRCKGACRCQKGYWRDNNGDCVPEEYCSKCKGSDEVYDPCPGCSPQTCETKDKVYLCPLLKCNGTCRCKRGYFRNKIGQCISAENCDKCKGPHEYFSCGSACDNKCNSTYGQDNCNIINIKCNDMCYCEKNYYRATNGTCIPKKDCKYECPVNERYDKCPAKICAITKCSEAGFPLAPCPPTNEGDPCPGKPGCVCNDGYLRNSKGVCIPSNECPSCGGDKNSTLGCGVNCGRLCSNYKRKDIACILICYANACDCRPDYVYDSNTKKCVLPKDCTPVCKQNEVYSTCINGGCQKKLCTDLNKPDKCVRPKECIVGCLCADGYLRASNGTCVPIDKCDVPPPTCKANEEFSKCGLDGCLKKYCSDLDLPPLCRDTFQCNPSCECKEGYLRVSTTNDTCVPVDQCPGRQCPKNEILVPCPQALCGPQNCSQAGNPIPCPKYKRCPGKPGCVCADGYLRNSKGVCIPKAQCPSCGGDVNAKPGCGVHCGNRCSNYNETEPVICNAICDLNGCDCRDGYVYDDNTEKCVKPQNCTKPCGVNEEYSSCANGLCRVQQCSEKGQSRPCPPMVPGSCRAGCVCPEKFLRSKNGTCVPEDQCDVPPDPICPRNEILVKCGETMCQPMTCKEAGFPVPCPIVGPDGQCPGKPQCICISGYLRNSKGVCVQKKECPSCGNDPNAFPGCGVNCGRLCSNYNQTKSPICPLICNLNGCDCKPNYVYDGNRRKCVLPEDCTPICQPTEVFSECPLAICRNQKCADKGKPVACPGLLPGACKPGCVCPEKYLRAANGTCIPEDQCEPTCPEGEILSTCPPPKCDGEYCPRTRDDPQSCKYPNNNSSNCSPPRCVCNFNSHRDRNTGKCIATTTCPPFKCGPNEYFYNCGAGCPGDTCEDYINNSTCPKFRIGIVVPCTMGCRCNKGYYRNSRNICIPGPQCLKKCGSTPPTIPPTTGPVTVTPGGNCNAEASQEKLEQGNTAISGQVLYQVAKKNPGKSVFISSFSLLPLMGIVTLYTQGATYSELAKLLNIEDKSDIRCGFPGLLDSIKGTNGTVLETASKAYVYDGGELSESLENDSQNVFNSKAESINFRDGATAAKIINQWVSEKTQGKITDLVNAKMFDASTRIALINAIYFKGLWKYSFNKNATKPRDFYVSSDKTIQIPTMTQKGSFEYGELSDCQVLKLPYQDDNLSLLVILPKERDGLPDLLEELQAPEFYDNILDSLSKQTVTVYLPKIPEISTSTDMKEILKEIGVQTVFDPSKAQLSGMTDPDENLFVSAVVQNGYFSCDEDGSTAAAATAVITTKLTAVVEVQPLIFDADHPFAFCINLHGMQLFCGTFCG